LKHTSPKHKDYVALTQAHRLFQQLVLEANERKRSMESATRITQIQDKMVWTGEKMALLMPSRELIQEGVFSVKVTKHLSGKTNLKWNSKYRLIVFSDILLVVKSKRSLKGTEKYLEKCRVPLHECLIWEVNPEDVDIKGCPSKTTIYGFAIVEREPPQRVVAVTVDIKEKEDWVRMLTTCVGNRSSVLMRMALRERERFRRSRSMGDMLRTLGKEKPTESDSSEEEEQT